MSRYQYLRDEMRAILRNQVAAIIAKHGTYKAAAAALGCDVDYLRRLASGSIHEPPEWVLVNLCLIEEG